MLSYLHSVLSSSFNLSSEDLTRNMWHFLWTYSSCLNPFYIWYLVLDARLEVASGQLRVNKNVDLETRLLLMQLKTEFVFFCSWLISSLQSSAVPRFLAQILSYPIFIHLFSVRVSLKVLPGVVLSQICVFSYNASTVLIDCHVHNFSRNYILALWNKIVIFKN